jgi:hypothetical protein
VARKKFDTVEFGKEARMSAREREFDLQLQRLKELLFQAKDDKHQRGKFSKRQYLQKAKAIPRHRPGEKSPAENHVEDLEVRPADFLFLDEVNIFLSVAEGNRASDFPDIDAFLAKLRSRMVEEAECVERTISFSHGDPAQRLVAAPGHSCGIYPPRPAGR